LASVTFNKIEFEPTIDYGKKHALSGLKKRPQDIDTLYPFDRNPFFAFYAYAASSSSFMFLKGV
jgi:hypothetical protein